MELYKIPKSLRKSITLIKILEEKFCKMRIADGQLATADTIAILIEMLKDEVDKLADEMDG